MAEALDSAQSLRIAKLRLKNQNAFKLRNNARLTRYPELGGKIAAHMGNWFYKMFRHSHTIAYSISRVLTATPLTIIWKKIGHQMEFVRS